MSDQLRLDLTVKPAPGPRVHGQLTELPGETWEDIFADGAHAAAVEEPPSREDAMD